MTQPEGADFNEVRSALLSRYPERCRQYGACAVLAQKASDLAEGVVATEMSIEDAQSAADEHAAQVGVLCRYGQRPIPGFPNIADCSLGLLCEFPGR